jgi:hypothetical protein
MNEMSKILQSGEIREVEEELPRAELLLFAPVDKRAFGAAIGAAAAAGVIALTIAEILLQPKPTINPGLLSNFFRGYDVTWAGAAIGGAWAFFCGFCAGWFTAFVRNLVLALSLFMLRNRAELSDTRDFLDHI